MFLILNFKFTTENERIKEIFHTLLYNNLNNVNNICLEAVAFDVINMNQNTLKNLHL